jgi:Fe-S cluster assembly protein SufD
MAERILVSWNTAVAKTALSVRRGQRLTFLMFVFADRGPREKTIDIRLAEESTVHVYGIVLARKKADLRLDLMVRHEKRAGTSFVSLKGICLDESRAKINGTIKILPAAQKSDGRLEERIIILSPTARAETIPNLEIEAHEVKASHAATVSKISDDELFYLATRGFTDVRAKQLLIKHFLTAQLSALPQGKLRAKLQTALERKLKTT